MRKVGEHVNVLSAWKVPGDVAEEARAMPHFCRRVTRTLPTERLARQLHRPACKSATCHLGISQCHAATSLQASQWSQESSMAFTPGCAKETLPCGWAGWGGKSFGFRLCGDIFRRGVFAEKHGGTVS